MRLAILGSPVMKCKQRASPYSSPATATFPATPTLDSDPSYVPVDLAPAERSQSTPIRRPTLKEITNLPNNVLASFQEGRLTLNSFELGGDGGGKTN
jgi:hypothetical protein